MDYLEVGKLGESLAKAYLLKNKYQILFCNYRFKKFEIDIVAQQKNTIFFIEVKTRKYRLFKEEKDLTTLPEEEFTFKKRKSFLKAVQMFIVKNQKYEFFNLQLCLIAIYLFDNHVPIINFYQNILE